MNAGVRRLAITAVILALLVAGLATVWLVRGGAKTIEAWLSGHSAEPLAKSKGLGKPVFTYTGPDLPGEEAVKKYRGAAFEATLDFAWQHPISPNSRVLIREFGDLELGPPTGVTEWPAEILKLASEGQDWAAQFFYERAVSQQVAWGKIAKVEIRRPKTKGLREFEFIGYDKNGFPITSYPDEAGSTPPFFVEELHSRSAIIYKPGVCDFTKLPLRITSRKQLPCGLKMVPVENDIRGVFLLATAYSTVEGDVPDDGLPAMPNSLREIINGVDLALDETSYAEAPIRLVGDRYESSRFGRGDDGYEGPLSFPREGECGAFKYKVDINFDNLTAVIELHTPTRKDVSAGYRPGDERIDQSFAHVAFEGECSPK